MNTIAINLSRAQVHKLAFIGLQLLLANAAAETILLPRVTNVTNFTERQAKRKPRPRRTEFRKTSDPVVVASERAARTVLKKAPPKRKLTLKQRRAISVRMTRYHRQRRLEASAAASRR